MGEGGQKSGHGAPQRAAATSCCGSLERHLRSTGGGAHAEQLSSGACKAAPLGGRALQAGAARAASDPACLLLRRLSATATSSRHFRRSSGSSRAAAPLFPELGPGSGRRTPSHRAQSSAAGLSWTAKSCGADKVEQRRGWRAGDAAAATPPPHSGTACVRAAEHLQERHEQCILQHHPHHGSQLRGCQPRAEHGTLAGGGGRAARRAQRRGQQHGAHCRRQQAGRGALELARAHLSCHSQAENGGAAAPKPAHLPAPSPAGPAAAWRQQRPAAPPPCCCAG